jgi:hypothetical protein
VKATSVQSFFDPDISFVCETDKGETLLETATA